MIPSTAQTVGPFFNFALVSDPFSALDPEWEPGYRINIVPPGREATPFEETHR